MTNSPIRTVAMLKNEIEKTKQTLVQTDETIKRITGRDGVENRCFNIILNCNNLCCDLFIIDFTIKYA